MRVKSSGQQWRVNLVALVVAVLVLLALQPSLACSSGGEPKGKAAQPESPRNADRFGQARFGEGRLQ